MADLGGILSGGSQLLSTLFGSSTKTSGSGTNSRSNQGSTTSTAKGESSKQLELDEEAISKIIQDVLGGAEGLASIFGGEQASGLFNSSVSAQASGDIASKLVGELAKLTAKEVSSDSQSGEQVVDTRQVDISNTSQTSKSGGILSSLFG